MSMFSAPKAVVAKLDIPASGSVYAIFNTILKRGKTTCKERKYMLASEGSEEQYAEWTRFEENVQKIQMLQCIKRVSSNRSSRQVSED